MQIRPSMLLATLATLIPGFPARAQNPLSDAAARSAPRIVVDASRVGEPMAPEIYSQFIEHLGRCIYGGIWAEMLEDRKFYYPVTPEFHPYRSLADTPFPVVGASPWQITGDGKVTMSTDHPFVGRHTPLVPAGTGIRQGDLGVTEGKHYMGYVWLKSAGPDAAQVTLELAWGEGDSARKSVTLERIAADYQRYQMEFAAGATTDKASLTLRVDKGSVLIGTASLMPADNVEGLRADTLALLKELQAPIYRWPGGNFVSGYDWRDGIGDRDRRPPRTNPAWTGVEHNDFGMNEFIRFCQLVKSEPWITVNTGFGDAHSAADQLEYCNGAADTVWGARRAKNGVAQPFAVKYWGIGNEMFGDWQLGHMKLEHYVLKQNWVVDTMRQVDPSILCIASGCAGPWSQGLLKGCPNHMNFIAEHFYSQERPELLAHVRQIPDNIRSKAEFHRKMRKDLPELQGKDIRIAMTEWNYWYGPHQFGIEDQGWMAWFVIAALREHPITVYGNGKQVRDPVYVEDLADAYVRAIERRDAVAGHIFNIGGGPDNCLSIWHEFYPLLREIHPTPLAVSYGEWRAGDQPYYVSDITRLREELDWEPQVGLAEGLRRLYRWAADHCGAVALT